MTMLLIAAGLAQIGIALGSLMIPSILNWHEDTAKLRPLTRQVFWTYAGYIWCTNVSMGFLSALKPQWLLVHSGLAVAVTGFIAVYWTSRVVIQFTYYDTSERPMGALITVGEYALDTTFIAFSSGLCCDNTGREVSDGCLHPNFVSGGHGVHVSTGWHSGNCLCTRPSACQHSNHNGRSLVPNRSGGYSRFNSDPRPTRSRENDRDHCRNARGDQGRGAGPKPQPIPPSTAYRPMANFCSDMARDASRPLRADKIFCA